MSAADPIHASPPSQGSESRVHQVPVHADDGWDPALWQQTLDWCPDPHQIRQFQQLYQDVLAGNQWQNLTRITSVIDFWEKHLWDSLRGIQTLAPLMDQPLHQRVIDIGTGGGFPGLPVAIACPSWSITLMDSTQRKVAFVNRVIEGLGLAQAQAVAERAETWGHRSTERESYDLALLRAIGSVVVCAEYAIPLLHLGGKAILYRGHWSPSEEQALIKTAEILAAEVSQIDAFSTPLSHSVRHIIVLQKTGSTPPQFPRQPGVPSHHPLVEMD